MSTIKIEAPTRLVWHLTRTEATLLLDALDVDLDAGWDPESGGPRGPHRSHLARLATELDAAVKEMQQRREK